MKFIACSAFSFLVFGLFCVGQILAGDSERRIFEESSTATEQQPESKSRRENQEGYSDRFWESYNQQNDATRYFLQNLKDEEAKKKEVTGYNTQFRRGYFRQRRQCIAGLRRNYRRRQAEERRRQNRKEVEPSKVEDTLEKSSHLQNEPSSSLRERGIYINQTGDIIIDARLLKNIYMQERVVTCAHCHKKVNLKNVFSHYKNTKHRFFTKIRLARGRNS